MVQVLGAKCIDSVPMQRRPYVDATYVFKRMIGDFGWPNLNFSETSKHGESDKARVKLSEIRVQGGGCGDRWGVL
jgi:hypothetical protein